MNLLTKALLEDLLDTQKTVAIYGGGFYGSSSSLNTKWCYQGAGFFGSEQSSSSFLFDLIPTGSSSNGFGTPPFRYNSVNYTGIPVLVADAQDYV